tara:strand:- start:963 stop:1205 length:243 start_codon:yes stop_codon:yes gene_type:complete
MADAIAISSIIVSVISGLVVLFRELHIQKCHSLCFDSDCRKKGSCPPTPIHSVSELTTAELKETLREIYMLEKNENDNVE